MNDCNSMARTPTDTHAEVKGHKASYCIHASYFIQVLIILFFLQMCSPAELRQKSEDLYAVIDEILANSSPPVSSVIDC